ncbi:major facilitator transporter [Colletotrichum chrysophilum]|uniref:Major facilitator transporter n=1 Tax=Colletotrichum chrysophilum TaxID=1836956 RepID=A0AAD9AQH3_9PEZI|nr:major facilitator transporter [Colletotrichum chrysophilum]
MSVASQVALASYANMFSIGTAYALSIVQFELPRLLKVSHEWSFAPFGAASAGLAIGVATAASSISKNGARSAAARGTALWGLAVLSTGHFLASSNFPGLLAGLFIGGIGVGWTYLAVIIMVGQAFPNRPLARSAIGPLGFSSGAAASLALSSFLRFNTRSVEDVGGFLKIGGMTFIAAGVATQLLLPSDTTNDQRQAPSAPLAKKPENFLKGTFWILLFFNALPGMVAFSTLLPGVSHYRSTDQDGSGNYLPYTMAALASGGLLATPLNSTFGTKRTFIVFFSIRAKLLIALWQTSNQALALVTLCAILFAHGAGFSILPGLIKSRLAEPANFPQEYGRVLTAWGAAGVVAGGLNATVNTSFGNLETLSLAMGSILLVTVVGMVVTPLGV